MIQGSCLCGAIQVQISGPIGPITACHCSQCRKSSGHHTASFDADPANIAFTGNVGRYTRPGGATWMFCPICGSKIGFINPKGELSIEAGIIDGPTNARLSAHEYVAYKGDYYDLADGLPEFAESGNG